ncbi:biliverdin-producing heme oxygenase [Hymenobacter sp. BT559]|uniref:biliverdin-producing heme oxygenase n=1 Tax=Hymenobacter sp. BT559 TaxID=2795729 RepID=UPI0018EA3A5B|nr:biliverdin-producing heme oxygenase [Hymenobacter sp. BT559]MBJ6143661.1 biliverdin-producing heme oxygenase [Hymenobacter sp. BT559]
MSPSPLLQALRLETRPAHDQLEQNTFNQQLTAGTITEAATVHFLTKMYGFLVPYEAQLRQQDLGPEWEVATRQRAHLILEDLQLPAGQLPACPDMPPLGTWPQLLGAMYVLEGSTLGGQVISRQLAKANIPLRSYFSGYGERTGPLWKVFCQLLSQEATPDNQAEIVQSASLTFQKLDAWLNQPPA